VSQDQEIPLTLLSLRADFYRRTGGNLMPWASDIPVYLGNDRPRVLASDETGEIVVSRDVLIARHEWPTGTPFVPLFEDRVKINGKLYQLKTAINAEHQDHHWEMELEEIQQGAG